MPTAKVPSDPSSASHDRPADTVSVAIVDDHPAIREAVRHEVEQAMDMVVVAETDSAEEAFRLVREHDPDVAIVDLSLGNEHSFELIEAVQSQHPDTNLLVFSVHDETVYAERTLRAGASGYLMKGGSMAELLTAVRQVAEGRVYLSPQMTARVLRQMQEGETEAVHFPVDELTDRERQVFQMLGQGLSIEAIADRLDLTRKTVETHRRRTKEKLGYETIDEVVSHAARWVLGAKSGDKQSESA